MGETGTNIVAPFKNETTMLITTDAIGRFLFISGWNFIENFYQCEHDAKRTMQSLP